MSIDTHVLYVGGHTRLAALAAAEQIESRHRIPTITDPMGRHWTQPLLRDIVIDEESGVARMTKTSFDKLLDYSYSVPSGKYVGKMWKSSRHKRFAKFCYVPIWYLRWYEADPNDPNSLLILGREIEIIAG